LSDSDLEGQPTLVRSSRTRLSRLHGYKKKKVSSRTDKKLAKYKIYLMPFAIIEIIKTRQERKEKRMENFCTFRNLNITVAYSTVFCMY
jgi:uncharacterized membrane protein YjdF